jgi:hypothetical protein
MFKNLLMAFRTKQIWSVELKQPNFGRNWPELAGIDLVVQMQNNFNQLAYP